MKHASSLRNVIALGVGSTDSKQSMVSLLAQQNGNTCISQLVSRSSTVKFAGEMDDILNSTLSGGPCFVPESDASPEKYFGCQNLSTLEMLEPMGEVQDNDER